MVKKEKLGKKEINFHSVQFKTWVYFFLMAAIILLILWGIQIIFFKAYYKGMKKMEVERVSEDIATHYPGTVGDEHFREFIVKTAYNGGLNIIVFNMTYDKEHPKAENVTFSADYISSQFNVSDLPGDDLITTSDPRIIENFGVFFTHAVESDNFSYLTTTTRGNYFVYGTRMVDNNYLYISSPMAPVDSTTSILANQLMMVTIICLLLSIILSWYISSKISKPITEFSRVARRLGEGDYSVKFEGNGYTEIEDLADTLNYVTLEMGKTEALRRDFLANVSHDLRTPLTMVKAYAEMIRDLSGSDPVKREAHSQVIIDEADRLTSLVNDILNLSKLQAGTENLEKSEMDMSALAKTVVERFNYLTICDGFSFESELDEGCVVCADARRIEQVLYNLVSNSVNYTGADKKIVIKVSKIDDFACVDVIDSGVGIAEEDIPQVWERYYRASQSKRGVMGSGLGLSIVKNILIAHNAQYGIKSELGKGSDFWFKLPLVSKAPTEEQIPPPKRAFHKRDKQE